MPPLLQGVRFNAEKKQVGQYHSTRIWSFRMRTPCCQHSVEIHTDPKNAEYVVVAGARRCARLSSHVLPARCVAVPAWCTAVARCRKHVWYVVGACARRYQSLHACRDGRRAFAADKVAVSHAHRLSGAGALAQPSVPFADS